ncbi:MAG: MotA/TolQ/ExbB proton channel family protein, partial [Candidatus Omnitrophica bacterium]|nr:MotA/TolQ/ExbB proton channel family protein [Candidatus Omnitrophota bacterium]
VAGAIIVYNFLTLQVKKTAPADFTEDIIQKLEKKKIGPVKALCEPQKNIIAAIVLEGLDKKKRGVVFAREAMENCARKEIGTLWQSISYLSDIAAVAPLIGLLGTVLGMIQAFNVIAFQTAVVKPILLAGGVSKAMVTTAAGLVVAIPVMLFYSYFRGKVQDITSRVETYLSDLMKLVEEAGE